jgi:signal peptidase I
MSEPTYFNRDNAPAVVEPKEESLWDLIKVILQAVVIAFVLRTLLFQPFNIPTGSLIPTLLIGDYVFASKYAYGFSHYSLPSFLDWFPQAMPGRVFFSEPKRGDIVVFRPPGDQAEDFIKRVIGLPGDKVQLKDARLYINGELVEREPLPAFKTPNAFGDVVEVPHYEETLPNGVKHEIIQIEGDHGFYSNTGVYEVPPGHYFMMGDNRDNSSDSRVNPEKGGVVGYVPAENLIARAEIVFFSVDGAPAWEIWRWPWTVRWGRLMHVVR